MNNFLVFLAQKEDRHILSPLIPTCLCVCVCVFVCFSQEVLVLFVRYFYSGRTHQLAPPQLSWFWAIFCPVITRTSMWVCVLLTFILIWRGSGGWYGGKWWTIYFTTPPPYLSPLCAVWYIARTCSLAAFNPSRSLHRKDHMLVIIRSCTGGSRSHSYDLL